MCSSYTVIRFATLYNSLTMWYCSG